MLTTKLIGDLPTLSEARIFYPPLQRLVISLVLLQLSMASFPFGCVLEDAQLYLHSILLLDQLYRGPLKQI